MPIPFQLAERLAGFTLTTAEKGGNVGVLYRELLGPNDASLTEKLEQLQGCLFSKISGLPKPSQLDHLVIMIRTDLSGLAYFDELDLRAKIKPNRAMQKGELVYARDIADISSVDLGVTIPNDVAVVVVRNLNWRRSLYYDFGPLLPENREREYDINSVLAQQNLLLIGLPTVKFDGNSLTTRVDFMSRGIAELEALLDKRSELEADYQQLLQRHPWMLAGYYTKVERHRKLDDETIPDFTATRCYDQCCDVIELKQPFVPVFKEGGDFSAAFNDAWNQAERYLVFCSKQRLYLLDAKELRFENPRCLLIIGHKLNDVQLKTVREKEAMNRLISILTYDQLIAAAKHLLALAEQAGTYIVNWNTGIS